MKDVKALLDECVTLLEVAATDYETQALEVIFDTMTEARACLADNGVSENDFRKLVLLWLAQYPPVMG